MKIRYTAAALVLVSMTMAALPVRAESSTVDEVKTWSLRQWRKATTEFRKDKDKWASCRTQSKDKKLKGKASWSFLYGCMKA